MATNISRSPEETFALGQGWGREAGPGWVIALTGDLGSGKTQLAKGIASGLGVRELVHSPTFNLVSEHLSGRLPFYHVDLYRLETPRQIVSAGLDVYFSPKGVAVIEWAERWLDHVKDAYAASGTFRRVRIESLDDTTRLIHYEDTGG